MTDEKSYQDNDNALLLKAETLLQIVPTGGTTSDEQVLVALVLLTRVVDESRLQQFCEQHHKKLFATFLVRLCQSDSDVLMKLVACLVSKCTVFSTEKTILQSLVKALQRRLVLPLQQVDVDLVVAIHQCLNVQSDNIDLASRAISLLWKRFQNNLNTKKNIVSLDDIEEESDDWKMFEQTLEALLPQLEKSLAEEWHDTVLYFMQQHAPIACMSGIPSFYASLITWIPPFQVTEWHGISLACTRMLATLPDFSSWLQKNDNVAASLTKLLLTHVATNNDELHSLAWDTLAALVESCGWDWMLLDNASSLDRASNVCGCMRMAAGEWRILLGLIMEQNNKSDSDESILESCGRVLVAGMAYMVQLAQMDDDQQPLPLNSDALLHVRHSLRDALHATVEYFLLLKNVQNENMAKVACRVLGGLLPEMLEDLPQGLDSALTALRRAMDVARTSYQAMTSLQPCLVSIFSVVDTSKIQKHDLMGNVLVDSISNLLQQTLTKDMEEVASSVTWSCHVLEVWCDVAQPSPKQRRLLSKDMLPWIQRCMDVVQAEQETSLLTTMVGCYMTLLGDIVPKSEAEQKLMERALRFCAAMNQR